MSKQQQSEWDTLKSELKEDALALVKELAPHLARGKVPPGQVKMPPVQRFYEYMLFKLPGQKLTPEQQAERQRLWETKYRDMSVTDRKLFAQWGAKYEAKMYGERAEPALEEGPSMSMEEELL